jgi:GNAT superfamily N-acetyltransferase
MEIPGLINLERSCIDKAVGTLTSAFSEDPCLKYLLDSEIYDCSKARHIHRYSINLGLRYGAAFATSRDVEGICIWMPPPRAATTTWMFVRAGGLGLRAGVDPGIIKRLKEYGDYSAAIHHRHAPFPHWYLLSIAVDKGCQGKGYANRLMNPIMEFFDRGHQPCYLETHNRNNVAFYEKYGFKVVEIGCLPGSQKTHWGMLRMPMDANRPSI